MNNVLLLLIMFFLVVVVALNLWLTFRMIHTLKYTNLKTNAPQSLSIGTITPNFSANRLTTNTNITSNEYADYAKVWLFLSTACNKCKGKLPELEKVLSATNDSGVIIRILTNESERRMRFFLNSTVLQDIALIIDTITYSLINPLGASPYYMFVDTQNVLQAEGMIGDENWLGFVGQLTELKQVQK